MKKENPTNTHFVQKMLKPVNRRLWLKVMLPISFIVIGVVLISMGYNITYQKKMGESQLREQNKMLTQAVEGGMFDALAIGDNDTVRKQFKRLSEKISTIKVMVYDFNGVITFCTNLDWVGQQIKGFVPDTIADDLAAMLEKSTEHKKDKAYHLTMDQTPFVLKSEPILNEARCFHCHGSSRKVLGGISVFSSEQAMIDTIEKGRNVGIIVGLAGLCVIVLFIWLFFHFMVTRKVHVVLDATSNLRANDFTHIYDNRDGDEINHIIDRINQVTITLKDSFTTVIVNSDTIFQSSTQLTEISKELNRSSVNLSEKATMVSASAEEMSINNQNIAHSMEEATTAMTSIASAVEEMSATVAEITGNVHTSKQISAKVVREFETISKTVTTLGERANHLDLITDEIRKIAGQVTILALNAKIEAARAGEAGKGFAVVAQEISELADQTNRSTVEADEKLQWIKDKTKEISESVSSLTGLVKESDDVSYGISAAIEEQNATTQLIAKNVNEVSEQISESNRNISIGVTVANEIAAEISAVEEAARNVLKSSEAVDHNAGVLSTLAEKFMALMAQFKVK